MNKGKIFMLAAVLMLTAGLVAVASQTSGTSGTKTTSESSTHAATKTTLHHETGKVDSLAADQLILDHTWKGKERKTTFTLDSSTKKEGDVEKGDRVMVYYHFQNGHRVATELKAMAAKAKTETNKS